MPALCKTQGWLTKVQNHYAISQELETMFGKTLHAASAPLLVIYEHAIRDGGEQSVLHVIRYQVKLGYRDTWKILVFFAERVV
jgi:hypothetical protein